MDDSSTKDFASASRLARDFLLYALALLGIALIGPILLAYEYSRLPQELELPGFGSLTIPIYSTFALTILASSALVKKITVRPKKRIRHQVLALGYVEDHPSFLLSNLGSTFLLWGALSPSLLDMYFCSSVLLPGATATLSVVMERSLKCQVFGDSLTALIAGCGIVYYLWMARITWFIEKETNQIIRVHYLKRPTSTVWLMLIMAGVVLLVGVAFYYLAMLGER